MAQLLVRNIAPSVVKKLRLKAARDGVSMEEEHRRILRGALLSRRPAKQPAPPSVNGKVRKRSEQEIFEKFHGVIEKIVRDRRRPENFPREIDW
jgi:plasmid stability protein